MDSGLISVGLSAGQDHRAVFLSEEIPPSSWRVFLLKSLPFLTLT